MVKYCIKKYPKGSLPGQKTPGRYIDGTLDDNLKILAKNIVDDMTYLGLGCSSTYEVGAGKSSLLQQVGERYTELVNQMHGTNLEFGKKNIVFKGLDLIERAFQVPKYSCLVLDEWDDEHYWSQLAMTLRQFFRKCRQLNLFIIVICPNFFQLPMNYAISRSLFLIDVRFEGEFERGYFRFYNFNKKKNLYIMGKKTQDYNVVKSNFFGRFTKGYAIPDEEYRAMKYADMIHADEETKRKITNNPIKIKIKLLQSLRKNLPNITIKELAKGFGVSDRTIVRWSIDNTEEKGGMGLEGHDADDTTYI